MNNFSCTEFSACFLPNFKRILTEFLLKKNYLKIKKSEQLFNCSDFYLVVDYLNKMFFNYIKL